MITTCILIAASLILVAKLERSTQSSIVNAARQRAMDRANVRAFADTIPVYDPYRTSLQFQTTVSEYIPEITEQQADTISNILGTQTMTWYQGAGPYNRFAVTGFDIAETIELHDPWKNIKN